MAKSILRLEARQLRQNGIGIKTIAHKLNVSSSTVSLWCRDIELTQEQIHVLEARSKDPYYGQRLHHIKKQQRERVEKIRVLREKGVNEINKLSRKEAFVAGVALYWAEGFKKDNQFGFSNSDPTMVKFFIKWLTEVCKIDISRIKIRVGINISYVNKIDEVQAFWSDFLDVPLSQFQKPYFQQVKWKKVYEDQSKYYGVLRIRISKSSDLLRTMFGWIDGVRLYSEQK